MLGKVLAIILATALLPSAQVSGYLKTYKAAVVEYNRVEGGTESVRVRKNLDNYVNFIKAASTKGADIIVFPESGLAVSETRSAIPDPADHIVPCDDTNFETTYVVTELSRAAKNNKIYTVVNLVEKRKCEPGDEHCPAKGYYILNTNVVFDRNGMVIARYSKFNLFDEFLTDHTADPELVFFDTDFGVRFGTFTCFDILFSTPAQRLVRQYGITDFVFTTHWFSELPFLTAVQTQRGWAETNNVNLLASGVNNPTTGSGGSGIYNGVFGQVVEFITEVPTSKLIIAEIPIISKDKSSHVVRRNISDFSKDVYDVIEVQSSTNATKEVQTSGMNLLRDQIHLFTSEVIDPEKPYEGKVCSKDNFCCNFYVTMDPLGQGWKNFTWRALAYHGTRKFGLTFRGGIQTCGVVLCDGPEITNCTDRVITNSRFFRVKEIRIKGDFNAKNSFQFPSTLTDSLRPLSANQYVFKRVENDLKAEVSLDLVWPVSNLNTFAIYGRDFTKDNPPIESKSSGSAFLSLSVVITSFLSYVFNVHQ